MKPKIATNAGLIKTHKSYSVEEILAAGGTTAFGRKREQENKAIVEALENAPPIERFSDEEWANLMDELAKDK